jgi:streptogramin lyase
VYAGNGQPGFSGDGGPATAAQLSIPRGLAMDSSGNLYIADSGNARIRKVSPNGGIATVSLQPYGVSWVSVDGSGNLYISGGHFIFRVDPSGVSTTIAGTGNPGYSGDGGPATAAMLFGPQGLRVDSAGNVYVADLSTV